MAKPGLVYGTMGRIEPLLEPSILPRFLDLDQDGKIMAEYVWLGGSGADLRCKTRVLNKEVKSVKDLPIWNYDGSSTGQAPGVASSTIQRATIYLSASNARLQLRHLAINTHVLVGLAIGWCSLCRPDSVLSVKLNR